MGMLLRTKSWEMEAQRATTSLQAAHESQMPGDLTGAPELRQLTIVICSSIPARQGHNCQYIPTSDFRTRSVRSCKFSVISLQASGSSLKTEH